MRTRLKLYVMGSSPRSQQAESNLRRFCDSLLPEYELEVVDVLEKPQEAEDEKIIATPTVVRLEPLPIRRILGDLTNTFQVAIGLDIDPRGISQRNEGGRDSGD